MKRRPLPCPGIFPLFPLLLLTLILSCPPATPASAAPSLEGCPMFPADSIWNTPVDRLPVSPSSSAYLTTIGPGIGLHPDFGSGLWEGAPIGIPLNIVSATQPRVGIDFNYEGESDPGPYPIPPNPQIEGGSDSEGDRHILVLDRDACMLYELFYAWPAGNGTWDAGSGAIFDLRSNKLRPSGWTSADAAGLPILPGLVRYDEVAAGEINHALRFTAPRTRNAFVWPGRHLASDLAGQEYPPMGQRFRLKGGFVIPENYHPQVKVILKALKKYGMILSDNGSSWYITGMPDPGWDNDKLVSQLGAVKGSDFEAVDATALMTAPDSGRALSLLDPSPPGQPVRLIFIHHSTGDNWLADDNGALGISLRDNSYYVSDTYYGWGPDSIGDSTDIGHWWNWFRGPDSPTYLSALYAEGGHHASYSRSETAPPGENEVIMFKSCFPNSALGGEPDDPVPAIGDNPLRGEGAGSGNHTVANAKGIYGDLLNYFSTRQDKLFVAITAPPLSDSTYADNARAFNQWLMNEWLAGYPFRNVAVFDFYNVLTTNGGNADTNDLGSSGGNHHRLRNGAIQHITDGDNDPDPNVLEYPSPGGDDHPSRAGNLKATSEFTTLLNIFYNNWKSGGDTTPPILTLDPPDTPTGLTSQTIGGTVEAGANVTVATDTAASDGPATVTGTNWSYTITGLAAGPNAVTVTARDGAGNPAVRSSSIIRNPRVTVTPAGSGEGEVQSTPAGISDTTGSAVFDYESTVTLIAEAADYSLFSGWTGAGCSTGDCVLTMDADKGVVATFDRDLTQVARIDGPPVRSFSSIQAAYNGAAATEVIKTWGTEIGGGLIAGADKRVTILGGYNGGYSAVTGYSTLNGGLTVGLGSVTVDRLAVR